MPNFGRIHQFTLKTFLGRGKDISFHPMTCRKMLGKVRCIKNISIPLPCQLGFEPGKKCFWERHCATQLEYLSWFIEACVCTLILRASVLRLQIESAKKSAKNQTFCVDKAILHTELQRLDCWASLEGRKLSQAP
jgi:hypothetical protein